MVALDLAVFAAGLALLVAGAEGLVRGGSRLAAALRVSPLVVGLTVVAFGTSAPELVVSVLASLRGDTTIAVGNVVGSNIFNVLAILGPTALVTPIVVQANVVRREVPILLGVTLIFVPLAYDGTIGRGEGAFLLVGIVAYLVYSYFEARRESRDVVDEFADAVHARDPRNTLRDSLFALAGLALLLVGGRLVVDGAVSIARDFGLSERVIAITLISAGTSLPELATTLVAAVRKQTDLAVGNVVGSGIFNLLAILGTAALVRPLDVLPETLRVDVPVLILVALATLPIMMTHHRISRLEGGVLVTGYVAYTAYLLLT